MNLVLDDAEEMSIKKKSRKPLGERLPLNTHRQGGRSHSAAACAASTVAHHAARRVGREDSAQGGQHYAHDERHATRGLSPAGAQRTRFSAPLPALSSAHLLKSTVGALCTMSPVCPRVSVAKARGGVESICFPRYLPLPRETGDGSRTRARRSCRQKPSHGRRAATGPHRCRSDRRRSTAGRPRAHRQRRQQAR